MPNTCRSSELLAEGGVFDRHWNSFITRSGQQQMACLVEQGISKKQSIIIEAASGSGKTLAYLVPIILQKKRAVISTASRYLQRQLVSHDIPLALKILKSNLSVALLQGRSHYLCPYYLKKNLQETTSHNKTTLSQLRKVERRYRESGYGELESLIPSISPKIKLLVTSGADDCLSSNCPEWAQCPLRNARQRAMQADLVVVNHSLLFADQFMKQHQFGELLPAFDTVIVDEAHRLTDFAQSLVGDRISSQQLKRFIIDIKITIKHFAPEQLPLRDALEQLELGLASLARRLPLMAGFMPTHFLSIVSKLIASFEQLSKHLYHLQDRHNRLVEMMIRNQLIVNKLKQIAEQQDLCKIQATTNGFIIHAVPLNVSGYIRSLINFHLKSWIFTSATLSVSDSPQSFMTELGLKGLPFYKVNSDINYQKHAALFTPELPVNPDHLNYTRHLIEQVIPVLELLKGRILFLFSSFRALQDAAVLLENYSERKILVHRSSNYSINNGHYQLIEEFKRYDQSILMATGSFWEGVDLSGLPIDAVIMDKLPFSLPTDPLVHLRSEELSRHGINSFEEYSLPEAVIRVRQGCGRLLRRINDRGVIMLADPRIHSKAYGQIFIDSLPAMQRCFSIDSLKQTLASIDNDPITENN